MFQDEKTKGWMGPGGAMVLTDNYTAAVAEVHADELGHALSEILAECERQIGLNEQAAITAAGRESHAYFEAERMGERVSPRRCTRMACDREAIRENGMRLAELSAHLEEHLSVLNQ